MALKDIPNSFDVDSEEDVRFAVATFFRDLGFQPNEMSFEDTFSIQLGHRSIDEPNILRRGEKTSETVRGRSDLLLVRDGQPLAIVEVKRSDHKLNDDDAWQAISYARLLKRRVAPYAIVTNGVDTKVYDTLADVDHLAQLYSPSDSQWNKSGRSLASIAEDLRSYASRTIVGLDSHTLQRFCAAQVQGTLEDLKGGIEESKQYVPELYLSRGRIEEQFGEWLNSGLPCFAVVGESGLGKTNFMCHCAEGISGDCLVLFYSAPRMIAGLAGAITNDFEWEFQRGAEFAQVTKRFDEIAGRHSKKLVILVDALDEFVGNQETLKAELLDFVHRIEGTAVRLCVSCKAYDWERYVIDNGQSYNRLAKSTYPARDQIHKPTREKPDSRNVGVWLARLTPDELQTAYQKYKRVFSLQGELRDSARSECEVPLMLRLVSEVYGGLGVDLPASISSKEVFEQYWLRKLNRIAVSHRMSAEQLLSKMAEMTVQSGKHQIFADDLQRALVWNEATENAYRDVIRFGLAKSTVDAFGVKSISFGFEKMRSYTYAVHAKKWGSREPADTASEICKMLANPSALLLEAVDFFLTVLDRGLSPILTYIAIQDLSLFGHLLEERYGSRGLESSIRDLAGDEKQRALESRLERYAEAYSLISRSHFPNLCERIVPYTKGEVGVLDNGYFGITFRSITPKYPQRVVVLTDEQSLRLRREGVGSRLWHELGRPVGHASTGRDGLDMLLPQDAAWNRLTAEITNLFANGVLDESKSPAIVNERIREVLFHKPNIHIGKFCDKLLTYKRLGFASIESVYDVTVGELTQRINETAKEFGRKLERESVFDSPDVRWLLEQYEFHILLAFWLKSLYEPHDHLERPKLEEREVFASVGKPEAAVPVVEALLPEIVNTWRVMIKSNLPKLADQFAVIAHPDAHLLVEITLDPHGMGGNVLDVRYCLLPPSSLSEEAIVYSCQGKDSLAHQYVLLKTLRHTMISSFGSRCGWARIDVQAKGHHIVEPDAIIYRTSFPSRHVIADQVYQLISGEAEILLAGEWGDWHKTEYPNIDYDHLARLVS